MTVPRQLPNPTDLIASSKSKYTLGQARIRRGEDELALLSFHGSLEDALRAHLLLRRDPAGEGDWPTIIESLRRDPDKALDPEQAEKLRRMNSLRIRVAHGDRISITRETVYNYQQFAASLLVRYDVVVAAPEAPPPEILPAQRRPEVLQPTVPISQRLFPIIALLTVFVLGVLGFLGIQQMLAADTSAPTPTAAAEGVAPNVAIDTNTTPLANTLPTAPTGEFRIGGSVYVQEGISAGLALRAQPSLAEGVPVRVYLTAGTAVTIIGGPVQADGYTWWQVRAAGMDGWCAGEFLADR